VDEEDGAAKVVVDDEAEDAEEAVGCPECDPGLSRFVSMEQPIENVCRCVTKGAHVDPHVDLSPVHDKRGERDRHEANMGDEEELVQSMPDPSDRGAIYERESDDPRHTLEAV
jgi:hypothetical protein